MVQHSNIYERSQYLYTYIPLYFVVVVVLSLMKHLYLYMATFTTTTFTEIMEKCICDIFKISGLRPHQKEGVCAILEEKGVLF